MNRPLCPHCYREACPWLGAYHEQLALLAARATDNLGPLWAPIPAERCSLHAAPLAPQARARVKARLAVVPLPTGPGWWWLEEATRDLEPALVTESLSGRLLYQGLKLTSWTWAQHEGKAMRVLPHGGRSITVPQ